jgi:hypothetical protein
LRCESTAACGELPDATCAGDQTEGAIALCGGEEPSSGVC